MLTCKVSLITLSNIGLCLRMLLRLSLQYILGFHPVLKGVDIFLPFNACCMYVYFVNFSVSFDNVRHHYCIRSLRLV